MGTMLAIGSAVMGAYAQNASLEAQGRAARQTSKNMIMAMNYSLQNLEQERQDAFDATVADLQNIKLNGNRLNAQVAAAVNEGMVGGGRTANLLKRATQAEMERTISQSKDNYRRRSNEIDLNKEASVLNTRMSISSLAKVQKPSFLSTLVNIGTSYLSGLQTAEAIKAMRTKAGVDTVVKNPTQVLPEAIAALTGGTYQSQMYPITQTPMGIYSTKDTYDSIFGNTNFKTGSFWNKQSWPVTMGNYTNNVTYDSLYNKPGAYDSAFGQPNLFNQHYGWR